MACYIRLGDLIVGGPPSGVPFPSTGTEQETGQTQPSTLCKTHPVTKIEARVKYREVIN